LPGSQHLVPNFSQRSLDRVGTVRASTAAIMQSISGHSSEPDVPCPA